MASYYGYAKRDTPPVDWSKISGDIIEQTYQIEAGREKERQELDKVVADNDKIISSLEHGQNPTFRDFTMRGADAGRDMIYGAYNQMKRGEISPSEYKRIQQSMMNQWGQFASATKSFNENAAKVQERSLDGKNSVQELANLERAAKIASVDGMEMVWSDGKLLFANVDEEGRIIDKDNTVLASSFNKAGSLFVNKVDVVKEAKAFTDFWGDIKTMVNKKGIKSIKGFRDDADIKQSIKDDFEKGINGAVESIAGANIKVASVLLDTMDNYTLTEDEASAPQYFVKRKPASDGGALEPDFSDDGRMFVDPEDGEKKPIGPWQKEQAQKFVRKQVIMGVGMVEEAMAVQTQTAADRGRKEKKEVNVQYLSEINDMVSGNDEVFQAVVADRVREMNKIAGKDESKKIKSIQRTEDKFIITYGGGTPPEEVPRGAYDADNNFIPGDIEKQIQGLSRLLTPIKGPWAQTRKQYEGDFSQPSYESAEYTTAAKKMQTVNFSKYPASISGTETIADVFTEAGTIEDKEGFLAAGANAVKTALGMALPKKADGTPMDYKVIPTDPVGTGDNTIEVTIGDESTLITLNDDKYGYATLATQLSSQVQKLINKEIQKINQSKGGSTAPGTTGGTSR